MTINNVVHRIKGIKSRRVHRFLSNLELHYFRILDLSPRIADIHENFPLSQQETLRIAETLGIRHPASGATRELSVMTSGFVITKRYEGLQSSKYVRTIKHTSDLASTRTQQKLEIEKQYWLAKDIDWAFITEIDIPKPLAQNAALLHPYWFMDEWNITDVDFTMASQILTKRVLEGRLPLREITSQCDTHLGLAPGISLALAYHLIATSRWHADWLQVIDPSKPLDMLKGDQNDGFFGQ